MALEKRDLNDQGPARDRRLVELPPEFDAEALVDEMLSLSEWVRDRRSSQ